MYPTIKKRIQNTKGFTLIELLAVLVISVIILTFTGSIIVNAMKSYEKTSVEVVLRDEADLIFSKIIKDIFPLKESDITKLEKDNCLVTEPTCERYSWILLKDGRKLGFKGEQVLLLNELYTVENTQIELMDSFSVTSPSNDPTTGKENIYTFSFELANKRNETSITFSNTFDTIND